VGQSFFFFREENALYRIFMQIVKKNIVSGRLVQELKGQAQKIF
jgi:hypothetical protein